MRQGSERYLYDGTWEGFLCCVFQCFSLREAPGDITVEQQAQQSLYPSRLIETRAEEALRVAGWLRRLGPDVCTLAQDGFLSCLPQREMHLLRLLLLARRMGPMAAQAIHDRSVSALRAAAYSARQETHLLTGFVRFVEHGGVLTAVVSPKNQVLPGLGAHFSTRFPGERIVIQDDVHRQVLCCQGGKWRIICGSVSFPPPDAKEEAWRGLWKSFYKAIGVEGRYNPQCRMTMMPKRYWSHMTEMEEERSLQLGGLSQGTGPMPARRQG